MYIMSSLSQSLSLYLSLLSSLLFSRSEREKEGEKQNSMVISVREISLTILTIGILANFVYMYTCASVGTR